MILDVTYAVLANGQKSTLPVPIPFNDSITEQHLGEIIKEIGEYVCYGNTTHNFLELKKFENGLRNYRPNKKSAQAVYIILSAYHKKEIALEEIEMYWKYYISKQKRLCTYG